MDAIRQYVISIVAAAILCAILNSLFAEKGTPGSLMKLISGIFLAFVVIRPIADMDLTEFPSVLDIYSSDASAAVEAGENIAWEANAAIIKQQTEAYILDKAESLNAQLTVEVTLSADTIPVPTAVRLSGDVSPYAKAVLESVLEEELEIAKENQLWTG